MDAVRRVSIVLIFSYHTIDSDIAFSKTGFELKLKSILWFLIHGSQVLMVLWFRKAPVFYLPPGWFGPAQRLLCLPFSPLGKSTLAFNNTISDTFFWYDRFGERCRLVRCLSPYDQSHCSHCERFLPCHSRHHLLIRIAPRPSFWSTMRKDVRK